MKLNSSNIFKDTKVELVGAKKINFKAKTPSKFPDNINDFKPADISSIRANYIPYLIENYDAKASVKLSAEEETALFNDNVSSMLFAMARDRKQFNTDTPRYNFPLKIVMNEMEPANTYEAVIIHKMPDYLAQYGIISLKDTLNFATNVYGHNASCEYFDGNTTEALEIFTRLNTKSYIQSYPSLLSLIYNQEKDKPTPDFTKLDAYCKFLTDNKINSLYTDNDDKKFTNRFFMIASRFNEFSTVEDITNAIEYSLSTMPKKLELINEILAKHPSSYKKSAEQLYNDLALTIDYYYEESGGQSLDALDKYFDYFVQFNKLNATAKQKLSSSFPFLDTKNESSALYELSNKTQFFEFLKTYNVSYKDLNDLLATSIIKNGADPKQLITLKDRAIIALTNRNSKPLKDNQKLYNDFAPVIVELARAKTDKDMLKAGLDVFDFYQIKSQKDIVDLYNKFYTKQRQTELEPNQLIEFIDILTYSDEASKGLIKHKDYTGLKRQLETKKESYLKTISSIQRYIKDNPDSFSGMNAYELYDKYVSKFPQRTDINSKLTEIALNISQDVQTKNKIRLFFSKLSDFNAFATNNKINFDLSADGGYRTACLDILNSIDSITNGDIKTKKDRIKALNDSGFLVNSMDTLYEFVSIAKENNMLDKIVNVVTKLNVTSVEELSQFLQKYSADNDGDNKVLDYLATLNNRTLKDCDGTLDILQKFFDDYEVKIKLNSDNIQYADLDFIDDSAPDILLDGKKFFEMAYGFLNKPKNKPLVSQLPQACDFQNYYTTQYIAENIITSLDSEKMDSAISNLLKALKLDKETMGTKYPNKVFKKTFKGGRLQSEIRNYLYKDFLIKEMPQEFIDLINSDLWTSPEVNRRKVSNISLHGKLKLIARFGLENGVENLYSKETIEKLGNIIKMIHTTTPDYVGLSKKSNRFVFCYKDRIKKGETIRAVVNSRGKIITIYPEI